MKSKSILVTGAAGFLGSHLVDTLLAHGHRVIGVDNLSHGRRENLAQATGHSQFTFHELDVCDLGRLREAASDVQVIAHLAAFKIPRYGKAIDTLLINSQGGHNTLQVAADLGAKFVITSTSDVYGKNPKIPFTETSDSVLGPSTVPRWAYAASKLFDEHLAFAYAEAHGIPVTILRIFGSYGPRQHLSWWGGPQSVFIDQIFRDEPITIHGDGKQTRSFTFVSDTVAGIAAAVETDIESNEIFNVGSTHEINILDLAKLIHRLSGVSHELRLEFMPYQKISGRPYEDVMRRVPDVAKAEKYLGFRTQVSLEDGLKRTIEWQRGERAAKPEFVEAK